MFTLVVCEGPSSLFWLAGAIAVANGQSFDADRFGPGFTRLEVTFTVLHYAHGAVNALAFLAYNGRAVCSSCAWPVPQSPAGWCAEREDDGPSGTAPQSPGRRPASDNTPLSTPLLVTP